MIRRPLAADADVFIHAPRGANRTLQHEFHRWVALIKIFGKQFHTRIAVKPQRELRQVVRTNRKTVKDI